MPDHHRGFVGDLLRTGWVAALMAGGAAQAASASDAPARVIWRQAAPAAASAAAPQGAATVVAPTATLNQPFGVAVDPAGRIYVANLRGNNVTVYSKARALIGTITAGISGPAGLSVAPNGKLYVANNGGNNVTIYDSSFAQVGTLSLASFADPTGIVVDGADDIWVLDSGTLHLLLDNGTEISSAAAVGASAVGTWAGHIELFGIYQSATQFLDPFTNIGEAVHNGISFPAVAGDTFQAGGGTEDAAHQVYETNPAGKQVVIYASNNNDLAGTVATASAGYGIAVDSLDKRFYVAEPGVNQVEVFSTVAPYKLLGAIH